MFYVYILKLKNNKYYIGFSEKLKQRVHDHINGHVPQTKLKRPATLEFYASFKTKKLALDFEKYLKTNSGFAFRNKRLLSKD